MNDVAVTRQDTAPTTTSETGALLNVIERVAMSPEADIAKLEKMFGLCLGDMLVLVFIIS